MSTTGAPVSMPAKRRAKGWLLAVSIAAIAVGAIKIFTGVSTAAAPAMMRMQLGFIGNQDAKNPMVEAQKEMYERTAAVYERHHSAVVLGAVGRSIIGIVMAIAGLGCIGLRRWARRVLIGACAAGAMFTIGLGPEMVRLQTEVSAESAAYFDRVMNQVSAAGGSRELQQMTNMMGSVMRTTTSATTVAVVGTIALMALACLAGAIFLLHPKIRARFI